MGLSFHQFLAAYVSSGHTNIINYVIRNYRAKLLENMI